MKKTFLKLISCAGFFCLVVFWILTFRPQVVYASDASTQSSEEPSTVNAGGLDGIGVKMDENGELSISGLDDQGNSTKAWNTIFIKYKAVIAGIAGIATLTMVVFFIINLCKIPSTSGNPTARSQALSGVLWTGLVTAALGGADVILAIAYNAFR